MQADVALRMLADVFWTGLIVGLPVMGTSMLVGTVVGVLQAVTQVQELSLSFIPKLIATAVVIIVFGPWIARTVTAFTARTWLAIPTLV